MLSTLSLAFRRSWAPTLAVLGTVALAGIPAPTAAQGAGRSEVRASSTRQVSSAALARGRYVIVVDLDKNLLHFTEGRRVIWSAPVGTGTGLRLETDRQKWDFSTPNGVFRVQFKELEPVWVAPDWYFVENKLPIPPYGDPKRRFPGGLGAAAVYIGEGLAIHGTDKPELLGQRVSHGCIRLANRDALRLFHNVQLGTEVVIVGSGRRSTANTPPPPAARARPAPARTSGVRRPPPRDAMVIALEAKNTPELLEQLEEELFVAVATPGEVRWPLVASVLVERGLKEDDDEALAGILRRAGSSGSGRTGKEYATFLADAYTRGTLRTLDVLGRLPRVQRERAARAIVEATIALYPGATDDAMAPWPTKRAPRTAAEGAGGRGWDALASAEAAYREQRGIGPRVAIH